MNVGCVSNTKAIRVDSLVRINVSSAEVNSSTKTSNVHDFNRPSGVSVIVGSSIASTSPSPDKLHEGSASEF